MGTNPGNACFDAWVPRVSHGMHLSTCCPWVPPKNLILLLFVTGVALLWTSNKQGDWKKLESPSVGLKSEQCLVLCQQAVSGSGIFSVSCVFCRERVLWYVLMCCAPEVSIIQALRQFCERTHANEPKGWPQDWFSRKAIATLSCPRCLPTSWCLTVPRSP